MKHCILSPRPGALRALAGFFLALLFGGAALPAEAALRLWTGAGSNAFWSTPANWNPAGPPQNGDDLIFPAGAPRRTSTNDLTARTFGFVFFNGASSDYELHGNAITLTGGLSAINTGVPTEAPQIIFPITLAQDLRFVADLGNLGVGNVALAGHTLTFNTTSSNSWVDAGGEISGIGNVIKIGVGELLYGGPFGNSYQGTTHVAEGTLRIGKGNGGPPHGVPGPLIIGELDVQTFFVTTRGRVELLRPEMIEDSASIEIRHGTLDLNGFDETVGPVEFHLGSIVTGTGTLFLHRPVSHRRIFPIVRSAISGRVFLQTNITFRVSGEGFRLSAVVSGPGGLTKEGSDVLELTNTNDFTGAVTVNDGMLQILRSTQALGQHPVVTLNDEGLLGLEEVTVANKTLTLTSRDAGIDATGGPCAWTGPINLNFTGQAQVTAGHPFNTASLRLTGPIHGTGGLKFGGTTLELTGNNDFTGDVSSACELLKLNTGPFRPFNGSLEVGGSYNYWGFSFGALNLSATNALCEARWMNTAFQFVPRATIRTNGWANLNGHDNEFGTLDMTGGRISGGGGKLFLDGPVTTHPAPMTALIEGLLQLSTFPAVRFDVADGPVDPDLRITAVISDGVPSGIDKEGDGEMLLTAANTYRQITTVGVGVLRIQNDTALGTTTGTTVLDGGTLYNETAVALSEPLTLAGAGRGGTNGALFLGPATGVQAGIVLAADATIRNDAAFAILSGVISGPGGLTKTGPGSLQLGGGSGAANTYGGDTIAAAGVVVLSKGAGVTTVPGHLFIGGGGGLLGVAATVRHFAGSTIGGSVTVNRGGLWDLNGFTEGFTVAQLQGRPPLTLNDGGDAQTGAGTLTLPAGGDVVVNPGSGLGFTSFLSGNLGLDPGPHRFVVQSGVSIIGLSFPELDVSAAIRQTSTAADLVKEGFGEMRLGTSNSFSGSVTVNGGRVTAAHASALGNTAAGTFVNGNALLALEGGITVGYEPLTLNTTNAGTLTSLGAVTNIWRGDITLQRTAGLNVPEPGGVLRFESFFGCCPSFITGPGGLTKSGPGAAVITGTIANNYTGPTTVNDGVLEASRTQGPALSGNVVVSGANAILRTGRTPAPQALPTAARMTVQNGALWTMNPVSAEILSSLLGDGRVEVGTGAALTISNAVSCEFSGALSGSGALNKLGLASLHLTGNSPGYTGLATVFDGKYAVDGSILNGPITVKVGSQLRGTGVVGDVVVENGGVVRVDPDGPGQSGGELVMNSANFQNGSVLNLAFFGPHSTGGNDHLFIDDAVTLTSPTLSAGFNYPPRDGDVITLINLNAAVPVNGTLGGFPASTVRLIGGIPVVTSYTGGNGNDVTFTVTNLPFGSGGAAPVTGGDGPLGPDDCSELRLAVTNRGASTLTGLRGALRSLTPGVLVTRAESAYPNLAPSGRGTNAEPFQIRTEPSFPCGSSAQFELILTSSNFPPIAVAYTLPGASGFGLDFDGRNDLVQLPVNAFPAVVNNFTIELWANPTATRSETAETNTGLSGFSISPRQLQRFAVFPDRGDLSYGTTHAGAGLSIGRNGISAYEHSTNASQGTLHLPSRLVYSNSLSGWTHVALVYTNRRPRLYVNGVLERSSSAQSVFPSVHASASLGGSSQGNFGNFDGQLDEVRIWNAALTAEQIQTNMLRSLTGNEPNLVTYFRCDAGTGTVLTDNAPASPNPGGTLTSGAAFVMPGVVPFGPACQSGGACESCFVVSGQFGSNALNTVRRLRATGLPSVCDPAKPCPDFEELPDYPVRHVVHHFTNSTPTEQCVTAQLRPGCPSGVGYLGAAAYLGEFRINQPCSFYLGDDGAGEATPPPFSFRVPPQTNFLLVVTARDTNLLCDTYALELFGLPCPPPTLRIARDAAPDKVLLQWSSAYPDFRLQSANSLNSPGPSGFGNVATLPVLSGGKFAVSNLVTGTRQFFRLAK